MQLNALGQPAQTFRWLRTQITRTTKIRSVCHHHSVHSKEAKHVAYIDDSEGSRSRRFLLLAACVAERSRWDGFNEDWKQILDAEPRISAFHMREARNRSGSFDGWKQIDVDLKVIALTEVIVRLNPYVVTCFVDVEDHKKTIGETIADLRNPFSTCFTAMVVSLARMQRELRIDTPVDYVFDEKGDAGNEALLWYGATKEAVEPALQPLMGKTPVFSSDEEALPLQAADLVAWRHRRILEYGTADPELVSTMRLDGLLHAEFPVPKAYLQKMAANCLAIEGVKGSRHLPSIYQMIKRDRRKAERRKETGR